MKPMDEKHLEILRRHMVEVIGIHTDRLEEELGKAAFAEPTLPRLRIRIHPCRSGLRRRSRSPSYVPS